MAKAAEPPEVWENSETGHIEGSTLTKGYITKGNEIENNLIELKYHITQPGTALSTEIQKQIDKGNTYYQKDNNGYYTINLGCEVKGEEKIEYNNKSILDKEYWEIITSNINSWSSVVLNFTGELPNLSMGCNSPVNSIGIIVDPKLYTDVDQNHPNYQAIRYLTKEGIINGHPDGSFKPEDPINRAELTKMVVEMAVGNPGDFAGNYSNCFPDVAYDWYSPYVCYAKSKNWVNGYPDSSFKPENHTNRVEATKIILNAYFGGENNIPETFEDKNTPLPNDIDKSQWYYKFYKFTYFNELLDLSHQLNLNGKSLYLPAENMTRKEVAELIYRLIKEFPKLEDTNWISITENGMFEFMYPETMNFSKQIISFEGKDEVGIRIILTKKSDKNWPSQDGPPAIILSSMENYVNYQDKLIELTEQGYNPTTTTINENHAIKYNINDPAYSEIYLIFDTDNQVVYQLNVNHYLENDIIAQYFEQLVKTFRTF